MRFAASFPGLGLAAMAFAALQLLPAFLPAQPPGAAEFIGSTPEWHEPSNWSTGQVPGPATDVVIDGRDVEIDPALAGGTVAVNDVLVRGGGSLTLLPGTVLDYNLMVLDDGGVEALSSEMRGDELLVLASPAKPFSGGMKLNPSTNDTRTIKINANNPARVVAMGLGGLVPASPGNTGAGHYATLLADEVELGGELQVELLHGFVPQVGDAFQIVTARQGLSGRFSNLPEGAVAAIFGDVALRISYRGGDGNEVVLRATAPPAEFIGSTPEWHEPSNWSTGQVPGPATDIVIDGVEVVIDPALAGASVAVNDVLVRGDGLLTLLPGTVLEYNELVIDDGAVDAFSSQLVGDELVVLASPGRTTFKGFRINPTTNDNRSIKIIGKVVAVGLGGLAPASPGNTGAGHYATLLADEVELGGELQVELLHGFVPQVGDAFQIVTARQGLSGRFSNLPEGAVAARFGDVELVASYDAFAVTLAAVPASPSSVAEWRQLD